MNKGETTPRDKEPPMSNSLDDLFRFHQQALSLRAQRQQVLASNIANADTPHYKARDIDFKSALSDALQGTSPVGGTSLSASAPGHLSGNAGLRAEAALLYRTPVQDSVDGNTVDMDAERAAFADNAIRYEFNLTRLNQQIKGMLAAIQG